jgi:hypothetical protein
MFWKSNTRNVILLKRHAAAPGPASKSDWYFVSFVLGTPVALALLPLIVVYWVVRQIVG